MTVLECLPYALFVFAFVFVVLAVLWILIKLFSFCVGLVDGSHKRAIPAAAEAAAAPAPATSVEADTDQAYSGQLKLHNVDEPTAAMIMAIVSDESGIPLSELCFKSIKAIENK